MSNSENKDAYAQICVGVREESQQQRLENSVRVLGQVLEGFGARVWDLESIVAQRAANTLADQQVFKNELAEGAQKVLVLQAQVMASQVHIARLTETTEKQAQRIASMQDRINKLHQRKGGSFTLKMVENDDE